MSVPGVRSVVFSGYSASSINKTDRHDITDILLKVALNTMTPTITASFHYMERFGHISLPPPLSWNCYDSMVFYFFVLLSPVFCGIPVAQSLLICWSLFVLLFFSFGHCIVCPSVIYGFWLSLWCLAIHPYERDLLWSILQIIKHLSCGTFCYIYGIIKFSWSRNSILCWW